MTVGSGIDLEGFFMTIQGPKDKNEEPMNYLAYANTHLKTNESPLNKWWLGL